MYVTDIGLYNENFDREYNGLLEAVQNLGPKQDTIVPLNQSDTFEKDDIIIRMIPVVSLLYV